MKEWNLIYFELSELLFSTKIIFSIKITFIIILKRKFNNE